MMVATAIVRRCCCHRRCRNMRTRWQEREREKKRAREGRGAGGRDREWAIATERKGTFTKFDSHQFWSGWCSHCVVFPLFVIRYASSRSIFFLYIFSTSACSVMTVPVVGVSLDFASISFSLRTRVTCTALFVFHRWPFVNNTVIIISVVVGMKLCRCVDFHCRMLFG